MISKHLMLEYYTSNGNVDLVIALLVAIAGAAIGSGITHYFTNYMHKKRGNALKQGLYQEVKLIRDYHKNWLTNLLDELKSPLRKKYSTYQPPKTNCLDALIIELIANDKILTVDQRKLIDHLNNRIIIIEDNNKKKEEHITITDTRRFHIPLLATQGLIIDCAATIYLLDKFISDKENYNFDRNNSESEAALATLNSLELDVPDSLMARLNEKS